jgi:hypothetical protein
MLNHNILRFFPNKLYCTRVYSSPVQIREVALFVDFSLRETSRKGTPRKILLSVTTTYSHFHIILKYRTYTPFAQVESGIAAPYRHESA